MVNGLPSQRRPPPRVFGYILRPKSRIRAAERCSTWWPCLRRWATQSVSRTCGISMAFATIPLEFGRLTLKIAEPSAGVSRHAMPYTSASIWPGVQDHRLRGTYQRAGAQSPYDPAPRTMPSTSSAAGIRRWMTPRSAIPARTCSTWRPEPGPNGRTSASGMLAERLDAFAWFRGPIGGVRAETCLLRDRRTENLYHDHARHRAG
jgi:hypothetical protein